MAMTYLEVLTKALQMVQDTAGATYDKTTEMAYWIEESLKELATYDPHIVEVIFKIESRTGTTTSATSLTDATKDQFVAADATDEKVVHNTTDNTWAVVLANSDLDVNTISVDIMASGDSYKIYNKRCKNEKQIYIGDVADYLWIDSVEYPLGTMRNFTVRGDILEIDVNAVQDSDSTLDPPNDIDVLVRFAKPHRLFQITTLIGELTADEDKGDTRIAIDGLTQAAGTVVEIGDEFHLENHRTLYTVTADTTLASGCGNIYIFPALEADATDNDDITFTKSTLKPQHEELFCHLVAARAVLSNNINYINANPTGGVDVWSRYQTWGERKLGEVLGKLSELSSPRTSRVYPRG